ncbi:helix-turn-helix domain-containing protein [Kurthia sibirica]|uniref:HTH cro/C1-type domain-containing protein n=1 Tax=Kurthia sibirica TaxID=202750 RepID=A0A2U3AQ45_9BACL|nr:helix-turn-helix transcriptional regulator [Kurthia sibirica]PWI26662.1 hypothetical protein DEX24_02570 [Kurthia sibirica]GEK32927.1 hypothetical protein KSI01_04600 [Kurthia sibirica]
MEFGTILKEIRLNRGYSQLNVSHKIISQGAYSKIEAGTRDLAAVDFIKIAKRLNLTPDEIEFISNGYEHNTKRQLIKSFFKLNYNDPEKLNQIKEQAMNYLKIADDVEIREVYLLCEAQIIISDTEDFDKARKLIEPIWLRLKTYDQWYLHDMRLINMMLILYPLDIAIAFTQRVLTRLEDYKAHDDVEQYRDLYNINLALLFIKAGRYHEALQLIENRLKNRKHMTYTMLALNLSRRAICKKKLNFTDSYKDHQQAKNVLQAYEATDLLLRIEEEYNKYTSTNL